MRRCALLLPAAVGVGAVGAALVGSGQSPSPSRPASEAAPATRPETAPAAFVEFRTADGHSLRGREYGIGGRWVILVHDEDQDSRAWGSLVRKLSTRGFRVLAFDRRGYGASEGPRNSRRAAADVSAALRFARSRGASGLYVVSAGAGASAALVAAKAHRLRALIALSPRPARGPAIGPIPPETRAPKLIIVGALDERAGKAADAVFRRSVGWVVLNSPPVVVQGTALLQSSWGDHVREQIFAFLEDYFDPPPESPQ
jgi:pimeloyl-ACP methyl ester carboxylesterase